MPTFERRRARSNVQSEALELYLQANAAQASARAAVLSDAGGLLISGTGDAHHEHLAALGPLFAGGASAGELRAQESLVDMVAPRDEIYACRVEVLGMPLLLTTIGARFFDEGSVGRVVERIFRTAPVA